MQTWAKRGLQTALVTGGLLMLGTGIASADEDVNPDKPASPLDGSVNVPVHIDNNVLGSPLGQKHLHAVHKDVKIGSSDVTRVVPAAKAAPEAQAAVKQTRQKVTGTTNPVADKVRGAVPSLTDDARDQAAPLAAKAKPVTDEVAALPGADQLPAVPSLDRVNAPAVDELDGSPAAGNQVNVDVVVPVDVSGNAIAVLGRAETVNESDHGYGNYRDVQTTGEGGFISGNVVDLDWALPVQISNNAVAALGKATAVGETSQEAWATGDIVSDGAHGVGGGNVIAPQLATPVQADGNAIAGAGSATALSDADSTALAGGYILTSGEDSVVGGNAVPVPVAVPVKANGNALMGLGSASAASESTADAQAGRIRTGKYGVPTYVESNGDPALAAGNIVQPSASGPVVLCGNAGGVAGSAEAACETASETIAGGTSRTFGNGGSVLSGGVAAAPVALPAQVFGNAAVVAGEATTAAHNTVDSSAGGGTYTRGHDSILSGTSVHTPVAGTADVFNNSVAGLGQASSEVYNDVSTGTGGYTGSTGDDSIIGGNMGTVPVTLPVEAFGNAVGAAGGGAYASSEEVKGTSAGVGGGNTADDNGVLASNLASVPVASAVQAFGNGVGLLADTEASGTTDDAVVAGGDNKATGTAGLGSGNIGQAPVSLPLQVFGNGASGFAKGTQVAANNLESEAGGDAISDGSDAAGSGNVVSAPIGGAGQLYGESVAALGMNRALADSETETEAGGDTATSGESGMASGNVASAQALPVVQSFANAASGVSGVNSSLATNATEAESGGDIDTNGDDGQIAGNLVDVPAGAIVQPFGNAVAVLGSKSAAAGLNETQGEVGGTSTSSGELTSLSGIDGTMPAGANLPVYDVPVEVLAKAIAESANMSRLDVGENEGLTLPVTGALAPTELPTIMPTTSQRSMPANPADGVFSGVLSGVAQEPGEFHILPAPYPVIGRSGPAEAIGGVVGDVVAGDFTGEVGQKLGNEFASHLGNEVGGDFGGHLANGLGDGVGNDVANEVAEGVAAQNPLSGVNANVNGVPVGNSERDLPNAPKLPGMPKVRNADDVFRPLSGISIGGRGIAPRTHANDLPVDVPALGELNNASTLLPDLPALGDLTDVTAVIPVVPTVNDMSEITTRLPAVPGTEALPGNRSQELVPSLTGGGLLAVLPTTGGRSDLPTVPETDDLTEVTTQFPAVPATADMPDAQELVPAVPAAEPAEVTTQFPQVPGNVTDSRSDLPAADLSGARELVPTVPAAELAQIASQVPQAPGNVTGSRSDLPAVPATDGLADVRELVPAAELSEITTQFPQVPGNVTGSRSDVPAADRLADARELVPAVPAAELAEVTTQFPQVPGNVTGSRSDLPAVQATDGLADARALVPAADLSEVTTQFPRVPANVSGSRSDLPAVPGDLTDITAVLPVIPGVRDLPGTQAPFLGALPVPMPEVTGVAVPGVSHRPHLDESSLDSTRAALANLFTTNPLN